MSCRFFIALLPPQNIQDYANQVIAELRDRHQTSTAKAPPHITLQPPFEWEIAKLDALESCLADWSVHQTAIPIVLSGFNAFAPRVLYIDVEPSPDLMALQAGLSQELETRLGVVDAQGKRRGFHPHMTVASRNVTPAVFKRAWAELQPRAVRFEFGGYRLTLLRHDGQRWQIQANFGLGS